MREWEWELGKEWQAPWSPYQTEALDGIKIVKPDHATAFPALLIG